MSLVMTKLDFCLCKKQSTCNCTADMHLCFPYYDSTIDSSFCGCICRFVSDSDLVGNHEDRFSSVTAQI